MRSWEQILSDILHVFRLDTIRRKILTFAVLATLIPSLTMGWLSYEEGKQIQAEKTSAELENATAHTAQILNLWVRERRHEAKVFSNSYEVTENFVKSLRSDSRRQAIRRLKAYLVSVRQKFVDYEELLVADKQLRVIATSAETPSDLTLPADWLKLARSDDPIVGDPYWDVARERPVMTIAVPVRSSDGRLLGILAAKLNFRALEAHLQKSPVAQKGQVYVVGTDGSLIIASHPLPHAFMETKLDMTTVAALFEEEGSSLEYSDYEGESVMGILKRVSFPEWGVVAQISQQRVFARAIESRNFTLAMAAALLVGIGLMSYFLGLTIVRPLERLSGGAAKVAEGDLEVDLPILSRGEAGYLTRVFNEMVGRLRQGREELAASNSALSEKNKELERLSITDSLTGLYNRKHLMETLAREAGRARRQQRGFSIMILDIDHFKQYNDTYGHLAGDLLLAKAASIFRDTVREMDFVARYGGEEFLIVLPQSDTNEALQVAERIRHRVKTEGTEGLEVTQPVTISIGVATFPDHGDTPVGIIQCADEALYEAKRAGRDRVVLAGSEAVNQAPA